MAEAEHTIKIKPWIKNVVTTSVSRGFNVYLPDEIHNQQKLCQVYPVLAMRVRNFDRFDIEQGAKIKYISDGQKLMRVIFDAEAIRVYERSEKAPKELPGLWEVGLVEISEMKVSYLPVHDMSETGEFVLRVLKFSFLKACVTTSLLLQDCPWLHADEDIKQLLLIFSKKADEIKRKRHLLLKGILQTSSIADYIPEDQQRIEEEAERLHPEEEVEEEDEFIDPTPAPVLANLGGFSQECVERLATLVFSREVAQITAESPTR